jgi:hypothetical protein
LNTLLLMSVVFLPFATSVLAGALRTGHGQRTAVVFYAIAFDVAALTFNAVWQYARRHRLLSEDLDSAGRGSYRQALSARPTLAHDWRPAWRRPTHPGRGRDRRVQRLLLASDPGRKSTPATLMRPGMCDEALELFFDRQMAELMVENWDRDEPDRAGELYVEPVELETSVNEPRAFRKPSGSGTDEQFQLLSQ